MTSDITDFVLKCDICLQYRASNTKQPLEEWNFRVVHSSSRFPQSNGLSEKTVSIVKRIFKKARGSKKDFLAILASESM